MFKKIVLGAIICFIIGSITLSGIVFYVSRDMPSIEELVNRAVAQSTKIYDRTGEILLYEIYGEEKRTIIPLDEIPDFIKYATISIEDKNFYAHPAFDMRGIIRAIAVDLSIGRFAQGGSTITQQLAKKSFLTDERTITRKIKELVLAWRLEKQYSKDEILGLYLNQVPYGSNAYGIEAAAQIFFRKRAADLNLNESALLAALPKAPTHYSPWGNNLDKLISRKDFILKQMMGLEYIDDAQFEEAYGVKPNFAEQPRGGIKAPHFVTYVQEYLNEKYGEDTLRSSGFTVKTSLNWEMQQLAEEAVAKGAKRNTELYGGKNASLLAYDPQTGQVLAMVGSADYFDTENEGNFNVAVQGLRQPGSTFKPFAYITAFQRGLTPDTIVWDAPTEFNATNDPEKSYKPQNFDEKFRGPITLKEALAQSINIPSVKTLYLAGVEETIKTAERFGITTLKDRTRFGLSLVLGGGEIKLIELMKAYSVFASDGLKRDSRIILEITDKNDFTVEKYTDKSEQVVDPQYTRLINDILSDSELRSPLFEASLNLTKVPGHQIALKTGTTNDYIDAWTIGYTPELAVGVWVGNNRREPLKSRGGSILAAVPIWHDFMSKALVEYKPQIFERPEQIFPESPILRGELPEGEPHDVLYYLDRVNDSQFNNWEDGIKEWLTTNIFDPSKFRGVSSRASEQGRININLEYPKNGELFKNNIDIKFDVNSISLIDKVSLYWNDALIYEVTENLGKEFRYGAPFSPQTIKNQNLLSILVVDESGLQNKKEVVLFH